MYIFMYEQIVTHEKFGVGWEGVTDQRLFLENVKERGGLLENFKICERKGGGFVPISGNISGYND